MLGRPADYSAWATDEKAIIDHAAAEPDAIAAAVKSGELPHQTTDSIFKDLDPAPTSEVKMPVPVWVKAAGAGALVLLLVGLVAKRRTKRRRAPAKRKRGPSYTARVKGTLKFKGS